MDFTAIKMASDDELQSIGLLRKGDILALRAFVQIDDKTSNAERDEKKRKLLETLKSKLPRKKNKSKNRLGKTVEVKDSKIEDTKATNRRISVGWQHFDPVKNRYVSVRMSKGGGSRDICIPVSSTKSDLIEQMKIIFFPDGKSIFGYATRMKMSLGNFKFEEITDEDFTLINYIKCHKLSKVRLYLLTKSVDEIQNIFESSESEDEMLSIATFDDRRHTNQLIGTMSERSSLRQEQDAEYQQSLTMDQEKENVKRKELQDMQDKIEEEHDLFSCRLSKVLPEPDANEKHVTVSVRHLSCGVHTRRFPVHCFISNIYDWVGSLSVNPAHFILSMCGMPNLDPSLPVTLVDRALLNMAIADETILEKDFPLAGQNVDDQDIIRIDDMWEFPPPILFEQDET